MVLRAENKNLYIRRALLALLILFVAALQNTAGLFPSVLGVRALLLYRWWSASVCTSGTSRGCSSACSRGFYGTVWRRERRRYNALMLATIGFVCGALIEHLMRNNLVTALLLTVAAVFLYNTGYWLINFVLRGYDHVFSVYLTFYLPSMVYTAALMPLFYYMVRFIKDKTR
jgi:hypothetical protein